MIPTRATTDRHRPEGVTQEYLAASEAQERMDSLPLPESSLNMQSALLNSLVLCDCVNNTWLQ